MNLIEKYIIKQIFNSSILLIILIISIFALSKSVQLIELSLNRGLPFFYFFKLITLTLPSIIPIILPIILCLSILFTYTRMKNDSEIIILESFGTSKIYLIKPVIIIGFILGMLSFLFTMYLSPYSTKEFKSLLYLIKNNYSTSLLEEGTFNTIGKDYTIFVKERTSSGKLKNVFIHDSRNKSKPTTLIAEKGSLIDSAGTTKILLENGTQQFFSNEDQKLSVLYFKKYLINLSDNNENSMTKNWKSPSERNFYQLRNPNLKNADDRNNLQAFKAEITQRLCLPINIITFGFMVASFVLTRKFNRTQNYYLNLKVIGLIMIQKGLFILFSNLSIKNTGFELLNFIPSVLSFFFAIYILKVNSNKI